MSISPQRILATLQGYRDAAALNTAIELELFTRIAHGADTAGKIAGELGIPVRGIRLLCDYLIACGLLECEDEQLKLPEDAARFLDKQSHAYLGNQAAVLYSPSLLRDYARLTDAVRAGTATTQEPPAWSEAARGVVDMSAAALAFADAVTLPAGQTLKILDLVAGSGGYGVALAIRYPNAVVVALDTPEALKQAQVNADAARLNTRYQNIPGDPLIAPLGHEYDAVLIAGSFRRFDSLQITSLLMRIHYALKKGGQFLILEFLAGERASQIHEFAGYRLNLLAASSQADSYSLAEVKGLLESYGFHSVESQPVAAAAATLVTARI